MISTIMIMIMIMVMVMILRIVGVNMGVWWMKG